MNANVSIYQDSVKDSSGILTSESNEMGLSTIFNYNGNNVAFIKTSYGILINATDMARPYNKRPVDYLRQIYVNELVSTIVSQTHISEDQLVIKMRGSSENGGGTWLYEDVAIDFAQWLDVKFKVWCNSKIKELLTTGLVKLPNFNNPPEAARAWADEYEARLYPTCFNCSSVAFSFGNFPCHLPGTTTSRPPGLVASLPHSLHSPMPLYGCSSLA